MLGIDRSIQQETLTAVDPFALNTLRMIREISAYDCPSFFREPLPLLLRDLRNLIATLINTGIAFSFARNRGQSRCMVALINRHFAMHE